MSTYAKTNQYWIAPEAVKITLNALGNANRVQASVASGAVVSCYIEGIEGLDLDNGRNPRRWSIACSPTYFNSDSAKYIYVAIPRSIDVAVQAMIVYPSEKLDLYGVNEGGQQIGSVDYFYVWLQGIISAPTGNPAKRYLTQPCDWGSLGTYEDIMDVTDTDWYSYSKADEVVTFLKEIRMKAGDASFLNFILNNKELLDVATSVLTQPVDSDKMVATPNYVSKFFLSKVKDDATEFNLGVGKNLTVGQGLTVGGKSLFKDDITFEKILKSLGARRGFTDGKGIWMDALEGLIETDGMNVRGFLRVMELIINRLQLMESDYSFTEGDTVDHVSYEDNGQTLVLHMHKDHDNDYTPFYPGDIIYGIKNDLLPRGSAVPDGHTPTANGSYFKTWMRVKSVDLANNVLRVALYQGKRISGYDEEQQPIYEPIVPGGSNFSPYGTQITTDVATPMQQEADTVGPDGYDTMLTVTRHGNVADGIDPATGQYDEHIHQSQLGRQQAWVLSTTDKRLTFFWRVDQPIILDDMYALCLGILPELANLPDWRNRDMPSLYVNTIFYDHQARANYPAKVEKVDRGQWSANPTSTYDGPYEGTYIPDGTLDATDPELADYVAQLPIINGYAGTYAAGDTIPDGYHYRTFTMNQWLTYRLDTAHYGSMSDKQLLKKMYEEWREEVDLEVSRVWNDNKLWECLEDGTAEEPKYGATKWQVISGYMLWTMGFASTNGDQFYQGHVQTTVTAHLYWGDEDVTATVGAAAFGWTRSSESGKTDADRAWDAQPAHQATNVLSLGNADIPTAWSRNNKAIFTCSATVQDGTEQLIVENYLIA